VSLTREDFAIVSPDPKHPDDPNRTKGLLALDPVNVAEEMAVMLGPSNSAPPASELHSLIYDANGRYVGQVVLDNPLLPLLRTIQEEEGYGAVGAAGLKSFCPRCCGSVPLSQR
jgi:hypothetical protein